MARYLATVYPEFPETVPKHPMAIQLGSVQSMLFSSNKGEMGIAFDTPDNFYRLVQGSVADSDVPPNTLAGIELKFIKQIAAESIQYADEIKKAADKASNKVTYPNTNLGKQMAIIAELIAGGLETPHYLATQGGYDTHANQLNDHPRLLNDLSEAINAFLKDLQAQNLSDKVVVMTFSEFGRRVNENGSLGTDHGTAAPMFFFGNAVIPGFVGNMPSLTDLDTIKDLKHQFEFKQVYATVLKDYLGASESLAKNILGKEFDKLPIFRKEEPLAVREDAFLSAELRNYPNPFDKETEISFNLSSAGETSLKVFDLTGREVRVLAHTYMYAGTHIYSCDLGGEPSGMYLCVLEQAGKKAVRRLMKV